MLPRDLLFSLPCSLLALTATARADVVACPPGTPGHVICLNGDVSDTSGGGPLVAGQTYHVGVLNVPVGETLTVETGAIVKVGLRIEVRGTLLTGGAIFTSQRDDSAGGDTNLDDPEILPARGDWDGIVFFGFSDASVVELASIRFAEVGASLTSADITLSGVTIEECSTMALDLRSTSFPIVASCSFVRNNFAVGGVPLEALPAFGGNSSSQNDLGDYPYVTETTMSASLTVGPGNSLGSEPFVVCRAIPVPAGLTLQLLPGTVIKFGDYALPPLPACGFERIDVSGTLLADGVTITALEDDTVSGDTNKDGNATVPAPACWGNIHFFPTSDGSVLENALIRWGGDNTPSGVGPTILLESADVTLESVRIEDGAAAGLGLNQSSFPTVANCDIVRHAGVAVEGASLGAPAGFTNNTASENAGGDYVELLSASPEILSGNASILKENALNGSGLFVVDDDITIADTGTLGLGGGVVFKWTVPANHEIDVEGTLTAGGGEPVVFTSLPDDEILGDSNKDSGNTSPAPGDWVGITFRAGSGTSTLDDVVVRYAGQSAFASAAVTCAGDPAITDTVIERSETAALSLAGTGFPTVTGCSFSENDRAVTGVAIRAVPGFSGNVASDNTNGDYMRITNGNVAFGAPEGLNCDLAIGPANALDPNRVLVFASDIDIPLDSCLEVLPGTIIKWDGVREIDVDGSIHVGGLGDTVVFTSCDDDSVGGDTKKDGFSEGAPGDWRQVHLSRSGSYMENALLRFGGSAAKPTVEVVSSSVQMKDVRIEDGAGTGLGLNSTALPVVDGCGFERNGIAVNGAALRALAGFSNNSAQDNGGDYIRVTDGVLSSDLFVQASQSLDGRPFVVADDIDVLPTAELTVDGGVVFKFEGLREVDVQGKLDCQGAGQPVVFTTLVDDFAGDTNKDGAGTVPAPGSWTGLRFQSASDASNVIGARVRYADSPAVQLFSADILITDTTIESSNGAGVHFSNNSFPRIRRTSIVEGLGRPMDFVPLAALPGLTENEAAWNALGDHIRVSSAGFTGPLTVTRYNALNDDGVFVVDTGITVDAGDTLELRQGTVFKWRGAFRTMTVNGELLVEGTGFEPVVLTSVHDDAIVGDAQNDGSTTLAAPGDWAQIVFNNTGVPSHVEHLRVRYGGATPGALRSSSPVLTARSVRVDYSASDGFCIVNLGGDAHNWVAYQCAGHGIDLAGGAFDLIHATATGNVGAGVRKGVSHIGVLSNSISLANTGGELDGFVPGEVFFSDAGAAFAGIDGNISADPMFVDGATGDLSLDAGSPCIDAAQRRFAQEVVEDHREASRILDHDLDGNAKADMGAFENAAYTLQFGGEPRIGAKLAFDVHGNTPGIAIFVLGPLGGDTYVRHLGFALYGPLGSERFLGVRPTGTPLSVAVSDLGLAADTAFGVQAWVRPAPTPSPSRPPAGTAGGVSSGGIGALAPREPRPAPSTGNLTNLYRARVVL